MKQLQFLVLSILMMKIHCGWELFQSELMDSSTFHLWINSNNIPSSNLLLVCDLQPTLNSKILQGDISLTRNILMSPFRGFSKIRISFDIYYFGLWNSVEALTVYANSLLVHYETPNNSYLEDYPMRYCMARPFGKSNSEKISRIDQTISFNDPQLNIEIVHEQYTAGSTSDYGITNFVLQVFYCDDLCEECDEYKCLTCKLGYELIKSQCRCNPLINYSFFNPDLQCLNECPLNHVPDKNGVCQLATINNIYMDLDQDNFNIYKFQYIPDKYYSTIQLMTQTIGTKSVAGMFGNTDKIVYNDISLPANGQYEMRFTLYMTGKMGSLMPEEILIKFNQFVVVKLQDFQSVFLLSYFNQGNRVTPKEICNSPDYQQCKCYSIYIKFDLTETVNEIEFDSKFTLNKTSRKWGIRDFVINQYQITSNQMNCLNNCQTCKFNALNTCLSCVGSRSLFKGMCIDQCPGYTSAINNVCVDSQIVNNNQEYLTNMFHDLNHQYLESYSNKLSMKSYTYFMNKLILGGLNFWSNEQVIHKLRNKKPFYKIKLDFKLVFIDSKNYQIQFRTSVNSEIPTYSLFGSGVSVGNQIGQSEIEVIQSVSYVKSFQSTNELSVQLHCIRNIDSEAYCGIFDYRIIIWTCQGNCLECDDNGNCLNQIDTISTDFNGCKVGYYVDNNGECSICDIGCSSCNGYKDCIICKDGYELRNKICYCSILKDVIEYCSQTNCFHNCQTCLNNRVDVGAIRPKHPNNCLSCDETKNLWLNVNQCTCLDGYYMENFSCYLCYPTCRKCQDRARNCLACLPGQNRVLESSSCECQMGYFQEDNDLVCSKCSDLCLKCNFTKDRCSSCHPAHNRILANDTCICMDGYYEVGKLNCQMCPSTCKTCLDANTCTSCYDSQFRIMSINNKSCTCQSGYFQQSSDVCGLCHISCLECSKNTNQSCSRCPSTREPLITNNSLQFSCKCRRGYYESNEKQCLSCNDYVNPPITHYCYSKCGDGIIQWKEDCDDGNDNYRDNCYKCLNGNSFCLDHTCTACDAGRCTACIDGFYLTQDSMCLPCDQSCRTCIHKSDNCTDCIVYQSDGSGCVMCNQSQGYQIQGDQCVPICGDGIKVQNEQCDDGNLENNDGCNQQCQVEEGYQCQTLCEKIIYPSIIFEQNPYDNKYDSQRIVRIKTDQQVSISGSINSIMKFKINNLNQYEITIIDLTQYSGQYTQMFLELNIQFQSVVSSPQLICQIIDQDAILNKQGNTFKEKNYVTSLLEFQTPSNSTESATDGLMKLSKYILYLLFGFAVLAFLFGGLNIFWNLLDVLQLVSYLQFLNVEYPYNVNNYFTIFGFAQFDYIKQYINLEQYISEYVNTPDADPKFLDEGYSTVFYVNIITVLTVFITTLITFIGCRMLFSTLTRISHSFIYAPIDSQEQSVCTFFIYRITRNLQQSLLKINQQFMSGVIRTFMAVAFDYNLALFLQIKDVYLKDPILFSSFIFCIFALFLEVAFIYSAILFMSKADYVFKQKVTQNHYGAIYEGVKLEKNPFTYYFNIILLIKKMLFMMFLVMFYSIPCIQIGLVSLLNLGMAAYLIKVKPLEDKDELIKQVGSEMIIWLAELFIMGFAINEQSNQLEENGKLNLGWFVIASTSFLILFQLFIDIKQHINFLIHEYAIIKKLIDRIRMFVSKQEPEEEQNIFLKGRRRLGFENITSLNNLNSTKNNRSTCHFKQGRVATFTVSSSSS